MKRLLVLAGAAVAVLLALHHPAPPAPIVAVPQAVAMASHPRKGHAFASAGETSLVYVVGAVGRPGLYRVSSGSRVNDAVERAGGLRADADPAAVNLAERVSDGEEIRVLRLGEAAARKTSQSRRRRKKAAPPLRVDVNAADENALSAIPGIGPTLASRIVEFRRLNGPFGSLDELADVAGMTQRRIDAMAAYAIVTTPP